MNDPVVTFLSDFGDKDEFAGVCRGVIAKRCPAARVIDVTHGVPRHDIRAGALMLEAALDYLPAGVHLAVVDPGVGIERAGAADGSARRAIALLSATPEQLLVGPDNGLLWLAVEHLGGVAEAADIGRSPERLEPMSATFHGRDVFAPVAAALACDRAIEDVGEPIDPAGLCHLELPQAHAYEDDLCTHVVLVDRYGNLTLDATAQQLAGIGVEHGDNVEVLRVDGPAGGEGAATLARYARTFGDVADGAAVLHEDSRGRLARARKRAAAAALLCAGAGDALIVRAR
jgi:S-adenosylmethionine hydrolase